jgi:hypothetical protein
MQSVSFESFWVLSIRYSWQREPKSIGIYIYGRIGVADNRLSTEISQEENDGRMSSVG